MELRKIFRVSLVECIADVADISDCIWRQIFSFLLANLPEDSWRERNDESVEFNNMEDADVRTI